MNLRTSFIGTAALAFVLLMQPAVNAEEQAVRLAPRDTGVFVEINNLAQHRADWAEDPVAQLLNDHFPDPPVSEDWENLQESLQMTGEQIIDTYFGRSVALISPAPGPNQPVVMLSNIIPADGEILRDRLNLRREQTVASFDIYATEDGRTRVAFNEQWIAIANVAHNDYLHAVLRETAREDSLADDAQYQEWLERLPDNRTGLFFIRRHDRHEVHVLGIVKPDENTTVHYHGTSPDYQRIYDRLGDAESFNFGPLPRATLAAVSLNMFQDEIRSNRALNFLNQMLAPKTMQRDVLPKLDAPAVIFLGEVPGQMLDEDPGVNMPVLGIAIRMNDPTVADDLDRAFSSATRMIGLFSAAQQGLPVLQTDEVTHAGTRFHAVNIGDLLAVQMERPELRAVKLAFGRVGDHYVITTQDMFFRQAINARPTDFARADVPSGLTPILRAHVRPMALGTHMIQLADFLQDNPHDRLNRESAETIKVLGQAMTFYKSMNLELYRDSDDVMVGRLEVIRE